MNDEQKYTVDPENIGETKAYVQGYRDASDEADASFANGYMAGYRDTILDIINGHIDLEKAKADLLAELSAGGLGGTD